MAISQNNVSASSSKKLSFLDAIKKRSIQPQHQNSLNSSQKPKTNHSGNVSKTPSSSKVHLNSKNAQAKRYQVVQLQVNTTHSKLDNSNKNIYAKAKTVFQALETAQKSNIIDNRNSTAKIFTLPEFFWSQYGTAFSKDQEQYTLNTIQEFARKEQFEGTVFVLGTMVTARPPEALKNITNKELNTIQEKLGLNLKEAYADATAAKEEPNGPVSKDRRFLSSIGDMYNAALEKANKNNDANITRETIFKNVLDRAGIMKDNLEGMKALWAVPHDAWPSNDDLAKLQQAYKNNKNVEVKNTLEEWMQPWSKKSTLDKEHIPAIMNFFEKAGNSDNAKSLMGEFREHVFPNMVPAEEKSQLSANLDTKDKKKYPEIDNKSMFRSFENKAITIEGGANGKMEFVSKVLPSLIDSPNYHNASSQPHFEKNAYQLHPSLNNPMTNTSTMKKNAKNAGVTPESFTYSSEKTGLEIGIAICRDYSDGTYGILADRKLKNTIHHGQVISAGVEHLNPKNMNSLKSLAMNDGANNVYGMVTNDLKTSEQKNSHIFKYHDTQKSFTYEASPSNHKMQMQPIDNNNNYTFNISETVHHRDSRASSTSSLNSQTNVGAFDAVNKSIKSFKNDLAKVTAEIDSAADMYHALGGKMYNNRGGNDKSNNANENEIIKKVNSSLDILKHNNKNKVNDKETAKNTLLKFIKEKSATEKDLKNNIKSANEFLESAPTSNNYTAIKKKKESELENNKVIQ
ncbi:hypothetical protein SCOR_00480 [Sulfidibacter corallicola]|uniref:Uncharacterized protein n=1 Tax=Sulfidibacter corallicola TaxID=2818388 RepID=A0A8A4THM6_SULCO|nr:hypothetical protein [Sulfidibacter corallicola]QTD48997.1 hypothetical protein J3U87_25715 [Sulfidibacter corallicola]